MSLNTMPTARPYPLLVTGAAGFIGSRFVEFCTAESPLVICVDQKSHFSSRPEHSAHQNTIIERTQLFQWLKENRPALRAIVHLGAITDTRETNRERLLEQNLEYSKRIWNYASQNRIPLIYASSGATYGDGALGYEDDEGEILNLKPLNLYGQSKQDFDIWALAEEKKGHHPPQWAGFKFFNVYGFGERHKGFMSSVVLHAFDQIRKTGKVSLFKSHRKNIPDGFQKRDFIAVEDVIDVLRFAIDRPIRRGIYNLGTGKARTFLDLAKAVFHALGLPEKIEFVDTPESIRDKYQYFTQATMDRLREQGYQKPFTELEEGVHRYVQRLLQNETQRRSDVSVHL